jgi:hypothetical protein
VYEVGDFHRITDIEIVEDGTDQNMVAVWNSESGDEHNATHAGSVAEIVDGQFVTRKSCFQQVDPDLAGILKSEAELHLAE